MQINKERFPYRPEVNANNEHATKYRKSLTQQGEGPQGDAWRGPSKTTTTKQKPPLRVFVEGVNERMRNTLRFFFQGPCKNNCVLAGEDSADLGIFDLDSLQGRQHMQAYRERHPGRPLILLSLHDAKIENAIQLRKPIKPERLLSALKQARAYVRRSIAASKTAPAAQLKTRARPQKKAPKPELNTIERALERLDSTSDSGPPPAKLNKQKSVTAAPPIRETHKAAMYLDEQEAHAYIGSAPEFDLNNAQQLDDAQYNPNDFIQGHLLKAADTADKYRSAVELKMPYCSIAILPDTHLVLVDFNDSRLHAFCNMRLIGGTLTVSVKKRSATAEDSKYTRAMSMESMLWKAAIWASRGRLPTGTSLTKPVHLRRWPNMTRLMLFPHAMRIAALWAQYPHSLLDTAKILDIPQRYVFSFYSAANALQLIVIGRSETDAPVESPVTVEKSVWRGFFSRILGHLRNKG